MHAFLRRCMSMWLRLGQLLSYGSSCIHAGSAAVPECISSVWRWRPCALQRQDKRHMVQAVYELYNITAGSAWEEGDARLSKLVVIGRNLKKDVLSDWFTATRA